MTIPWVASTANPQFTPILNRLSESGLPVRAYYVRAGSGGRGWGDLKLDHEHEYLDHLPTIGAFIYGLRVGLRRTTDKVVVFGYTSPFAIGLLCGAKMRRLPVFTQSDSDYAQHRSRPRALRALKQVVLRCLYPTNTRVWTIGPGNCRYWENHGLSNQRAVSFESPIPQDDESPEPRLSSASSDLQVRVLYVGRFSPEKRIPDAVEAVRRMGSPGRVAQLYLVGGTSDDYRALTGHDPEAWVHPVGRVPHAELASQYQMSDVLVLPSSSEPYGLVVREAMQFGLPVVASHIVPAARDLCDYGWNRYPVGDICSLEQSLRDAVTRGRWPLMPAVDNTAFYFSELGH